jgi:hypothetical protein
MFSLYILQTIWKAEIFHRSITMHRYSNWDVMAALPPHKFSSPPACHYTAHWQLDSRTLHCDHTRSSKHRATDDICKKAPNKQDPDLHNKVILPAVNQCTDTASLCGTGKGKCAIFKLYCFCWQQMQAVLSIIMENKHTHMHKCIHAHIYRV